MLYGSEAPHLRDVLDAMGRQRSEARRDATPLRQETEKRERASERALGGGGKRASEQAGREGKGDPRARAKGESRRAAGRSRASLPSARSARYAISLAGYVYVTLTFTPLPFGSLPSFVALVVVVVVVLLLPPSPLIVNRVA